MSPKTAMAWPLLAIVAIGLTPDPAGAQSIAGGLLRLLTDQTPPPPGYVRDSAAAETTFRTVAGLFKVDLTSLPVATSAGGFVYRFSPTFGTVERTSDSFGPFFTERALRSGEGRLSLGLAFQHSGFNSLQGADITGGTFPTNTARFADQLQPFSVDTLSLTLEADTWTGFASYGVTDRLDVGIVAPVTRLRFSGRRSNTFFGETSLQSVQSGSATGLGDVSLNARYNLFGSGASGVAAAVDLRLPTGRDEQWWGWNWRRLGRTLRSGGRNRRHRAPDQFDRRADVPAHLRADDRRRCLSGAPRRRGSRNHAVAAGGDRGQHGVSRDRRQMEPRWQLAPQCPSSDAADGRRAARTVYAVDVIRVRGRVLNMRRE
jgi:hypothetical protein